MPRGEIQISLIQEIRSIHIIPTGDELVHGVVLDTSSRVMAGVFREAFPGVRVRPHDPVEDSERGIIAAVETALGTNADLVVVSGGSGGGRRHLPSLAPDCTHSALLTRFPEAVFSDIRGREGHLWCRIVVAPQDESLVMSVPGPHVEAVSAARAAARALQQGERDPLRLTQALIAGVLSTYPTARVARL